MSEGERHEALLTRFLSMQAEPVDPNTIAAYLDDALGDAEREAVEGRLAADPEAMLLLRTLREERRRRALTRWTLPAMAAVVLVALGLAWSGRSETPAPTLAARLDAVAAALRERDAVAFDGFVPIDQDALREEPAVMRADGAWLAPVGVLLDAPRELRWRGPRGATRSVVEIEGEGTRWSAQVEGERADPPALGPGRYVVRLRALDALAGQEIRRVFVVADEEARARHARALAAIRETAPGDVRALVVAHYALHNLLLAEARDALSRVPRDDAEVRRAAADLERHLDALAAGSR